MCCKEGSLVRICTNHQMLNTKTYKSCILNTLKPGWPSGYGGGLLIHFPHGFPGSNPGPGVK